MYYAPHQAKNLYRKHLGQRRQGNSLTKTFGDLRIVHLGILSGDLPSLHPRPDHKSVHGSLDLLLLLLLHAVRHLLTVAVLLLLRTGKKAHVVGRGGRGVGEEPVAVGRHLVAHHGQVAGDDCLARVRQHRRPLAHVPTKTRRLKKLKEDFKFFAPRISQHTWTSSKSA